MNIIYSVVEEKGWTVARRNNAEVYVGASRPVALAAVNVQIELDRQAARRFGLSCTVVEEKDVWRLTLSER